MTDSISSSFHTSFTDFDILKPYNPWWADAATAFERVPDFRRDVFDVLYADVKSLPQMVSVTGPRRVGKSTLLLQCIKQLIADAPDGPAQAQRIVYFSMQDPGLELPGFNQDKFFNDLVAAAVDASKQGVTYLFLDEIQRFPRWELYLKKYYDLKTPVRIIVSGSASTPIFKKSRESLLGRIKDFHVLPFSFREWYAINWKDLFLPGLGGKNTDLLTNANDALEKYKTVGATLQGYAPSRLAVELNLIRYESREHRVVGFLFEGGFPEVWALPTLLQKQDYLYQNQVERVIFEDLLIAAEFRKPEMLRRFYLGLLKDPGREVNIATLAKLIELDRRTIETYFPLLEATDLIWRLHKHTSTKASPKAGNFKTYLVDLAVRNAVMKLSQAQMVADPTLMGAYAENVVANHLRRWPGLVELGYWRRNHEELDFIVDLGHSMIGIEVKYRNQVQDKDVLKAVDLAKQLNCAACIVVSKTALEEADMARLVARSSIPLAVVPLAAFLMLF